GKTVSLIGCGYVGRCFRELLRPFDCPVLVADPFMSDAQAEELGVARAPLAEALLRADVVSLHAPDVPETRGMIGPRELAMLRDGCVLLNTARGRIIDTDALTAEAGTGRILAALDVTDPEPLPEDHPLRRMANVLLTPHVAGPTTDDLPRLGEMAVADLGLILRGERPRYPISLDDYDRMSF
ncbi:MAG: hydroxyacid dehydrogenase, partial [Armatimonadetes bacterium]|nr:hydroxyacid dehydrogenase [Armatimonadota bacterium]